MNRPVHLADSSNSSATRCGLVFFADDLPILYTLDAITATCEDCLRVQLGYRNEAEWTSDDRARYAGFRSASDKGFDTWEEWRGEK